MKVVSAPGSIDVFDDVVATLNEVAPFDWRNFLLTRLNSTDFHAPLGGIERGGWKLAYQATPNGVLKDQEQVRKFTELGFSIGLRLNEDGSIADVIEGLAAAKAGIGPGMKLIAVNGKAYSAEILRDAVKATTDPRQRRIDLLIDNEGHIENHQLSYGEGEKYPVLERDQSKADVLSKIIAPLTWTRALFNLPPPGLTLGTDGVLSGTPQEAGRFAFAVTITDGTQTAAATIMKVP